MAETGACFLLSHMMVVRVYICCRLQQKSNDITQLEARLQEMTSQLEKFKDEEEDQRKKNNVSDSINYNVYSLTSLPTPFHDWEFS